MEKRSITLILGLILTVFILFNIFFVYEDSITGKAFKPLRESIVPRLPAQQAVEPEIVSERHTEEKGREGYCSGCWWADKMHLMELGVVHTFSPQDLEYGGILTGKTEGYVFDLLHLPESECYSDGTELYAHNFKGKLISGLLCKDQYWTFIKPLKSACPNNGCSWKLTDMIMHVSPEAVKYLGYKQHEIGAYDFFGKKDLYTFRDYKPYYDTESACVPGTTAEDTENATVLCPSEFKGKAMDGTKGFICVEGRWTLTEEVCTSLPIPQSPAWPCSDDEECHPTGKGKCSTAYIKLAAPEDYTCKCTKNYECVKA